MWYNIVQGDNIFFNWYVASTHNVTRSLCIHVLHISYTNNTLVSIQTQFSNLSWLCDIWAQFTVWVWCHTCLACSSCPQHYIIMTYILVASTQVN